MPTVSASQSTQYVRSNAYQNQVRTDGPTRLITHLYQPRITTTGLKDFLSNPNAYASPYSRFTATVANSPYKSVAYAAPKYIR